MARAIEFILTNLPVILFVSALLVASLTRGFSGAAERYLSWLLLLSIGVESIWAGFFHVFFPQMAAAFIQWQVSPFQFEIGIADLAIGITAVISFWRGLEFKSAVVCYIVLFFVGVAIGHVHQAIAENNFSAGNFGALLALTVAHVILLTGLLIAARRHRNGVPSGRWQASTR